IKPTTATSPRPTPAINIVEPPFFSPPFFLPFPLPSASASTSPPLALVFDLGDLTVSPDFALGPSGLVLTPDLLLSSSSPARLPGSSTTKRYLHLGQSTFLPTRLGSLMGTMASQLGHCCLNCVWEAIEVLRERSGERIRDWRADSTVHHTGAPGGNA